MGRYETYLENEKPIDGSTYTAKNKSQQLEDALIIKDEGNKFFKEGDYDEALKRYEKAFEILLPDLASHDHDRSELLEYEMMMLGNIAAVKLKKGKFKDCKDCCKKIIYEHEHYQQQLKEVLFKKHPNIIEKAYFRRGIISLEEHDYDQAIYDFEAILAMKPDHALASSHLLRAKDQLKLYEQEQRRKLKGKLFK